MKAYLRLASLFGVAALLTVGAARQAAAQAAVTDYYVDYNTGVDAAGNGAPGNPGSQAAPWKTFDFGYHQVPATGGFTVHVGAGIYQGNSNGSGFQQIDRQFSSLVVITTTSGVQDVVIQGYSDLVSNVRQWGDLSNTQFQNIKFTPRAGTLYGFEPHLGVNATNMSFDNCLFEAGDAANSFAFICSPSSNVRTHDWTLTNCSFTHVNVGAGNSFTFGTAPNQTATVRLINCTGTSAGAGLWLDGANLNVIIQGGYYTNNGTAKVCVLIGADGAIGSGQGVTGSVTNATIISYNSHALEGGDNSHNLLFSGNIVQGADHSIALKNSRNATVQNNSVFSGTLSGIILKGGSGNLIANNTVTARQGFGIANVDSGHYIVTNSTVRDNYIVVDGGTGMNWDMSTDGGGNSVDYTTFEFRQGYLANVGGVTNITTLSGITAAWMNYTVTQNDSHDILIMNTKGHGRR